MSRRVLVGLGILVLFVGSACGLSSRGDDPAVAQEEGPTPTPTEAPMMPVSINDGLASLDSYRMTYRTSLFDSSSQQRTETTIVLARDQESDTSYARTETKVSEEQSQEASVESEEQYRVGNQLCHVVDGEAELTTLSGPAQVLSDLMSQVIVFEPLIENPVYVRDEIVNGVPARTYTFEVRSVDAAPDVEATRAGGSYAIAVDGEYLVQYTLDMELRTGPEEAAESEHSDILVEASLEQINQPLDLVIPPNCQVVDSSGG
jgi:hypothetical protein